MQSMVGDVVEMPAGGIIRKKTNLQVRGGALGCVWGWVVERRLCIM